MHGGFLPASVGCAATALAKLCYVSPLGVTKLSTTKARRRREKAERIKAMMEQEAEARRAARQDMLAERKEKDAKASVR